MPRGRFARPTRHGREADPDRDEAIGPTRYAEHPASRPLDTRISPRLAIGRPPRSGPVRAIRRLLAADDDRTTTSVGRDGHEGWTICPRRLDRVDTALLGPRQTVRARPDAPRSLHCRVAPAEVRGDQVEPVADRDELLELKRRR